MPLDPSHPAAGGSADTCPGLSAGGHRPATLLARPGDAPPAPAPGSCDTCAAVPATHVLSYPDGRMKVCERCLPIGMLIVAEPLDIDDALASDERGFLDRLELW